MNPDNAFALIKRGEINQALGDHDEAVKDYDNAAKISPNEFDV